MAEIKQDFQQKTLAQLSVSSSSSSSASSLPPLILSNTAGRVLFIVKDSLALAQLRDVLVSGVDHVCDQRFRWFISQQAAEIRSRVYKQYQQQQAGNSSRWSGNKRRADTAGGGANKQPRGEGGGGVGNSSLPVADNRNLFLYPKDSDLLGVPLTGKILVTLLFYKPILNFAINI